jgi:hypothetical protein
VVLTIHDTGVFLSTNDQYTLKLSVGQLMAEQNASTGQFPYAASPIYVFPPDESVAGISQTYSFTYHLYNLLALNNYYIYSGDLAFLKQNWNRFVYGLKYSLSSVDSTGLAYVGENATADWLRVGMGARNIEANSILAYTLSTAIQLGYAVGDTSLVSAWEKYYSGIVSAANSLLWDEAAGLYKDNQTTTLHPQDGNVWAVISGVANSSQAATISSALQARWGSYGAPAPGKISLFFSLYVGDCGLGMLRSFDCRGRHDHLTLHLWFRAAGPFPRWTAAVRY